MVIDSLPMADQDESMNTRGRRRGFRTGGRVPTALCAAVIALIALSGCTVYVGGRTARNPFLGEWHTEFTSAGTRFSAEYEFRSNGRYSYIRQSASGVVRVIVRTQGRYRYDDDTLVLTPDASDVDPSRFEYEFTSDDELELEEQISPSITLVLTYHRH